MNAARTYLECTIPRHDVVASVALAEAVRTMRKTGFSRMVMRRG
jgi:hypothetical protein